MRHVLLVYQKSSFKREKHADIIQLELMMHLGQLKKEKIKRKMNYTSSLPDLIKLIGEIKIQKNVLEVHLME